MDDHGAHDDTARRRLELPRRQPGGDVFEDEAGWADGPLPGGLARADILGDEPTAGTPPAPDAATLDASSEADEPSLETPPSRSGSGDAIVDDDEPRPHFRTPEEMLADEDWPELPGGGEIWDSAAAPGDDLAIEDEPAD